MVSVDEKIRTAAAELGRKGGKARNKVVTKEQMREWGRKGGKATVAKHGKAHFKEIGSKSSKKP